MNTIGCIVVDNDVHSAELTSSYIHKIPFLNLIENFKSTCEAYTYIKTHPVDLIFLDIAIEDGELTGTQLLESVGGNLHVIVTSVNRNYAIKAFELEVEDYLLKPFEFHRFVRSVNRVYDKMFANNTIKYSNNELDSAHKNYIFVRTKHRMQKINFEDIYYIQALSNYLIIKTADETIYTLQRLPAFLKYLPEDDFVRIHRSYVIAIGKIEYIHKNKVKIGERLIPLGESYKQLFYDFLKNHELF
jgi:DNA-binding LytR/AlgR family response regulator